ncbi:MAG: nitronate monooxygenase [Ectothiorhodospiraceae bacterium]|jgi:nitronate monooxygenase
MVENALTEMLGIHHPLLLAPMGNVAGGELAAAVSGAGGLGLIGAGYGDREWLARELDRCRIDAPFGVGFITWSLARQPELLDLALDRRPAAVMFSFGDPMPFVGRVHDAGARVICQVQTVADARRAVECGADVIVAQGTEAGGHGAGRSTLALVPAVVDAAGTVPVVAAGGIVDGRGTRAALALGADGVLVGTRFIATPEALAPESAKRRIVAAGGDDTVRTTVFDIVRGYSWPAPYTGRALRNGFTERWHGREAELRDSLATEQAAYREAVQRGDVDTAVVFAGEGVDGIHAVEPAAAVVEALVGGL